MLHTRESRVLVHRNCAPLVDATSLQLVRIHDVHAHHAMFRGGARGALTAVAHHHPRTFARANMTGLKLEPNGYGHASIQS